MRIVLYLLILTYLAFSVYFFKVMEEGLSEDEEKANKVRNAYEEGNTKTRLEINSIIIFCALFWPILLILPRQGGEE